MMSTLLEVEKQLEALSPRERAELVQRVACQLAGTVPGIESTPGVCGGEACIAGQDLVNAGTYVKMHGDEIEQQIRENEEA